MPRIDRLEFHVEHDVPVGLRPFALREFVRCLDTERLLATVRLDARVVTEEERRDRHLVRK